MYGTTDYSYLLLLQPVSYSLQSWQRSRPNSSTLDGYYPPSRLVSNFILLLINIIIIITNIIITNIIIITRNESHTSHSLKVGLLLLLLSFCVPFPRAQPGPFNRH